jgi:signal transduction histidine kinase/DNA-binding NarL/FixJ family response regulator
MDGFETAALIRARRRSENTPIIFVTADADDTRAARGYSLGAVDYILAPLDPSVLRSKVTVFVDLFRKTEEVKRQAAALGRHARQLQQLAESAFAIHGATSIDELLKVVGDTATVVVPAHEVAIDLRLLERAGGPRLGAGKAVEYRYRRPENTGLGVVDPRVFGGSLNASARILRSSLRKDPEARGLLQADKVPNLSSWLAAPLVERGGRCMGWIQFGRSEDVEFVPEDEATAAQLAHFTVMAIENILYSEAQEANRLKEEFLATLSHELRTPLQAMLSWTQILQTERADPAMFARGLEVIERSAKAQTQLIDALLDVSRITSGKVSLENQVVSLRSLLLSALDAARPDAAAREVTMRGPTSDEEIRVRGDPNRLGQVIANLLSNAIKFTPSGGMVNATLDRVDNMAEIRISDTGEGIRREFLPHVFERFRQGDSSSTRRHGGLGIGLSVVRQLVELHGGRVKAESAGEGLGATFIVQLPSLTGRELMGEASRSEIAEENSRPLMGLRVLLVDDQREARECLGLMLKQHGAEVRTAETASEALSLFESHVFDVLLSDVAMPQEDGLTFIRRIRERPAGKGGRVPAAAVSAYARPEEVSRAIHAGFDLHLAKPLEEEALILGVLKLVGGSAGDRVGSGAREDEATDRRGREKSPGQEVFLKKG